MSWYTVGGATYTIRGIAPQEPGSIDACWRTSLHRQSSIARGSAQSELWDLGDDWPWWHWGLGGLFVTNTGRDQFGISTLRGLF